MMAMTQLLAAQKRELLDEIEASIATHDAAPSALLREHVAISAGRPDCLLAASLCVGLGTALGLGAVEARRLALIVGFVELAAEALRGLSDDGETKPPGVQADHGLPLALNSGDGLYSLAHLAIVELESEEGGRRLGLARTFDALALELWEAAFSAGEDAASLRNSAAVTAAAGRLAGELAGRAAAKDERAIQALGEIGAVAVGSLRESRQVPADVLERIRKLNLSEHERTALAALFQS